MQYDKNEFIYYYNNYLDIKSRIEDINGNISELLEDDELKDIVDFYNHLNNQMKKRFNRIMHHNNFVRYKLKVKMIEEFEKSLDKLYQDFIKSKAFPFSKDEFHFFVSSDTYLVDAITDVDSSELNKEENTFLRDIIASIYKYNPNDYSSDDIPLIKVLYLKSKASYVNPVTLCDAIKSDIRVIKNLDAKGKNVCSYRSYQYKDSWKIDHFKNKLLIQEKRVLDSDSKYKDLLLFSIRSAFYELELLSGTRVTEVLEQLENVEVVNQHQERKRECEMEALIKAYYNLTDINFRENSNYFSDDDYIFARFETADKKVNEKMLKMMKR